MSGFLGAIEGAVGGVASDFLGGGDFLSELTNVLEGTAAQASGNSSASEAGQVASEMLPIVASFL